MAAQSTASIIGGGTATTFSGESTWRQLYDDADPPVLFNNSVLPAASAWRRSEILDVRGARLIGLWVFRTIDATGGTGSYPQIIVYGSAAETMPAHTSTTAWTALPVTTGIMTAVVPTGTLPTGAGSLAPDWSYDTGRRFILRLEASDNDTDAPNEGPYVYRVDLVRWLYVCAQEIGDASNPEKLNLYMNSIT